MRFKPKIYSLPTHSRGGLPTLPQVSPAITTPTTISDVVTTSQPTLPMQQPIFIIYTGQQPPKSAPNIDGKMLIQAANGQILNDAAIVQATSASASLDPGKPLSIINGGSELPPQAQIIVPASQTNGITRTSDVSHHIPNGHNTRPAIINGQAVIQTAPTLINFNRAATLVQQSNSPPAAVLPPHSLLRTYTTAPPQIMTTTTTTSDTIRTLPALPALPPDPSKRHTLLKQTTPICISRSSILDRKRTPPPLLQVNQDTKNPENNGTTFSPSSHTTTQTSATSSNSSSQVSPKIAVLPFPLISEAPLNKTPTQNIFVQAPMPTSPPYIVLDEKLKGRVAVRQPNISSMAHYNGSGMPIYRFNNIHPVQILTPIPPHTSNILLPDFMKQDPPTAH